MGRKSKFSPEVQQRAVRFFSEQTKEHSSQWAAIASVAVKIGCTAETLGRCVRQAEVDQGRGTGLTTDERELLKQLQREKLRLVESELTQ